MSTDFPQSGTSTFGKGPACGALSKGSNCNLKMLNHAVMITPPRRPSSHPATFPSTSGADGVGPSSTLWDTLGRCAPRLPKVKRPASLERTSRLLRVVINKAWLPGSLSRVFCANEYRLWHTGSESYCMCQTRHTLQAARRVVLDPTRTYTDETPAGKAGVTVLIGRGDI